ncbi:proteinrelated to glucan 1, 4-alpha-glucosidase [Metarhizium guizhouense ARSEF 977]|uniref:Proteinrelated to glucan 1, 4-alpha-glucosidase n=1 Tax=Metarhizium guizhouense (strain ARSEF 977) TaxID=1276136 RepID=A0A0B4GVM3_METGA|nr:proteinrelated to glucan 1, 4-alpha-glucosidase [Metarhizium guizhouense ARSEF 977]
MTSQQPPSASRRPRLSLQIKTTVCSPPSKGLRGIPLNPSDPTTFNTMSNIYVTAIERSSAIQSEPVTAIKTLQNFSLQSPIERNGLKSRVATPFVPTYPETPLTAQPVSPQQMDFVYPSTMTATPPLSAGPVDNSSKVFTFPPSADSSRTNRPPEPPVDDRIPRRRRTPHSLPGITSQLPYTHPRSLHSILRNSPLPPRTAIPPPSPRRQSLRLQEKAAKKVEYDSPLEEEITTSKYVRSHIDLLSEDASPMSPAYTHASPPGITAGEITRLPDVALAFTANEIQDGGQTPGPVEEMGRRMAGLAASPVRRKREKKRRWVWTIGQDDEDDNMGGAVAASRAESTHKKARAEDDVPQLTYEELPTPSIESISSVAGSDADVSDTCSVVSADHTARRCLSVPSDTEVEAKTPTAPTGGQKKRDTPIPELADNGDGSTLSVLVN